MSIGLYIKGAEMPTSCQECPLKHRGFNGSETVHYCYAICKKVSDDGEVNEDCPLIPITEHGRLIDADALCELCDIMADKCDGIGESIWHQFRTTVECTPTIIPAKEGEQ